MPPKLVHENGVSGGEQIQAAIPDAKVVKCFNIIGNPSMVDPAFEEGEPDMFLCGNDEGAKATVTQILKEFGWNLITDIGGIEMSRHLESMCIVWVAYGVKHNNWHIGFKMLRK